MAVFTIADTHLSLGDDKPMDVFPGWTGYVPKLEKNWRTLVKDTDTVVLPGDISWAMRLEDAAADFAFLDSLPGTKLIGKGNHDYWWCTMKKMRAFAEERGFDTIRFLFNNAYLADGLALTGCRGWFFDAQEEGDNAKVILREAGRLRRGIEAALALGQKPVVFTHYPVAMDGKVVEPLMDVLLEYQIERVYFGPVHGDRSGRLKNYTVDGVRFTLASADSLYFCPLPVKADGEPGFDARGEETDAGAKAPAEEPV